MNQPQPPGMQQSGRKKAGVFEFSKLLDVGKFPNPRFERLERAWHEACAAREPEISIFPDWLPAVLKAVPDTNIEEITEMLDWAACKYARQVEASLRKIRESTRLD